jgi:chromosome segregation ATPase
VKYLIAALIVIIVIAGAFLGGYYARNSFSLFGSDTVASLRELGGEHSRLIAELKNGEREYTRQLEFYRERTHQLEAEIAADADRISRLVGGIGKAQSAIDRATGNVETARAATNRIGEITERLDGLIRQLSN